LVTEKRFMPPWKPEPGVGKFTHERRLTDEQIRTLREWSAAGAPEGEGRAPEAPKFPDGWQLGAPDRVFQMPVEFEVPADGPDRFECFVIPTELAGEMYMGAAEFRPGNPRVVHHALVMLDYPCFGGAQIPVVGLVFGWAPGSVAPPAEPGISRKLEKGTDIVVQLHYHPSGKVERDRSSLGFYWSEPPSKGVATVIMLNTNLYLPAGSAETRVQSSMTMPQDGELFAIAPHAHYLGKEMKVDAHLPDGSVTPLLWIKDWDFNWQGQYRYETPVKLPKGTRVEMEFSYDNSAGNPQNPSSPPKMVRWGEQTTDEMAVTFLGILLPKPEDVAPFQRSTMGQMIQGILTGLETLDDLPPEIPPAMVQQLKTMLAIFDRNRDGKFDDGERATMKAAIGMLLPQ
jgi:hypothetical protein